MITYQRLVPLTGASNLTIMSTDFLKFGLESQKFNSQSVLTSKSVQRLRLPHSSYFDLSRESLFS